MPREEMYKKDQLFPWYQCKECSCYILHKDTQIHENNCPPNSSLQNFIQDKTLWGTLDIKTVTDEYPRDSGFSKDALVFLSQSAITLCQLAIGQWAVVEFTKPNDALPPVAKRVWPTTEKTVCSVLFTQHGLNLTGATPNMMVTVNELALGYLPIAAEVTARLLNSTKTTKLTTELSRRINKVHSDNIYCVKNIISVMFFGKVLKFEIESMEAESSDNLVDSFERLSVGNRWGFYRISKKTIWKFSQENGPETEDLKKDVKLQVGGLDQEFQEVREAIRASLVASNTYGLTFGKSVLLYGNSGTGKTLLANCVAREFTKNIVNISAATFNGKSTSPEETVNALFDEAIAQPPSIMIFDEVDVLCPARSQRTTENEKRITSALLAMFEKLNTHAEKKLFILGTTNKIDAVDPMFRRYGRFDREIEIGTPTPKGRRQILSKLLATADCQLSPEDLDEIALITHGFVGADLVSLCSRAALHATTQCAEKITLIDFKATLKYVSPSAMREVQVEVANVKWSDIAGQEKLKRALKQCVEWPMKHPESFKRLGVTPPKGVLMFGPPGCSKTMIARALATESGLNFLSIKGPELFSKWVGESEKAVRDVFRKARQVAPSIIFFDEIDAIGGERGSGSSTSVQERVLAQILTELDGVSPLGDVLILAATNRPDRIDKALLRPGRLDRIIYVPLPDDNTRQDIFLLKFKKMPIGEDVDVGKLVASTNGYSGAEVNAICTEAAMMALEDDLGANYVEARHFERALKLITPRTSQDLIKLYENYLDKNL